MEQVSYLGHVISVRGMESDSKKVAAAQNWQTPTDASGLWGFLGLASYYRRYIKGFADVAAPLHHLLSKGVTFTWDTACQEAFDRLKTALIQAPVLSFPDFNSTAAHFSCKKMLVVSVLALFWSRMGMSLPMRVVCSPLLNETTV